MKGFKKLLTGILAATMIMGASITAFASESASITITNENNNSGEVKEITYTYYQILKADIKSVTNDGANQSGTAAYYVENATLADMLEKTGLFTVAESKLESRFNVTAKEGVTGAQIVEALNTQAFKDAAISTGEFKNTENGAVADSLGYNEHFDKVSDLVMALSFLVVASFGVVGMIQLVRTKSIAKVSRTILGLGILYLIIAIIYVAFDKIPINYRPLLQPGESELETSFPSSHTLVICTVFGSAIIAWKRLIANRTYVQILKSAAVALMVIGVCARLLAGVHWMTDIIAGILFSFTLVSFYAACSKG